MRTAGFNLDLLARSQGAAQHLASFYSEGAVCGGSRSKLKIVE
jgi:hypothetical protein